MNLPVPIPGLLARFDDPHRTRALILLGSYARDTPGQYSDIDLYRLLPSDLKGGHSESHLIDHHLITLAEIDPGRVEQWFADPDLAITVILSLRDAVPLIDRAQTFHQIHQRAIDFTWNDAMIQKARRWTSREMVNWIEEVHKGLQYLLDHHIGRAIQSRNGLSWGLARILQVHLPAMTHSENDLLDTLATILPPTSPIPALLQKAFAIDPLPLRDQVIAALNLYIETAHLLKPTLQDPERAMIMETVQRIAQSLAPLDQSNRLT